MAATDIYLCTGTNPTAVDLRTATPCGVSTTSPPTGGGRFRHLGNAPGSPPRQVQRLVRFQWRYTATATVNGQLSQPATVLPPHTAARGHLTGTATYRHPATSARVEIAIRCHVTPHPVALIDAAEDELLLLDLL